MSPNNFRPRGSTDVNVVLDMTVVIPGVAPGMFQRGADSSDEEAKIWFSGYYKCQKSPKNRYSPSDGGYTPLALLWRHPWVILPRRGVLLQEFFAWQGEAINAIVMKGRCMEVSCGEEGI